MSSQAGPLLSRSSAESSSVIRLSASGTELNGLLDKGWTGQSGDLMQNNSSSTGNTNNHFSNWSQSAFPDSFSDSSSSKWGPNSALSSSQSTWGSPSTSQNKQAQSSSTSDWNMTTGSNISSHRGISNTGNSTDSEDSSWGQPKRLPNSGTDGWSQSTSASSYANLVNPSNIGSQPNQWSHQNNTTSPPVSSSAWSSNGTSNNTQTTSSLNNNNSALKPWGVSAASAQNNPPSSSASVSSVSSLNSTASTSTTNSAPTSWAGACAKGLPKVQPKQVEPTDPVQLQIEQSINNPEAWGRTPIRQDTSWGKPPEKKKQDDSNQWQATPNNGTAIWEASKSTNGTTDKYDDKSTWNQKVCGNNDPNVWNGEGEKGKDNNLWDSVENEEDKAIDQNTWNPHESPRTLSQSSAENSDGGWSGHGNRSSPTNVSGPISNGPESNWGATNGATDLRKHSRWESNSPVRSNSVSDADNDRASPSIVQQSGVQSTLITPNALLPTANQSRGNNLLWEQTKPTGGIGWTPKQQQSWSENSPSTGSNSWIPGQQTNAGGQTGWAENLSSYQWNSAAPIRKPTAGGWEDQPSNGDFRDRRILKSESDVALQNDADMGDWNESVSVWTSAVGFKPKKSPMNNESFTAPMVQSNRMLNQMPSMPPPVINQGNNNMNNSSGNNPAQNFTKSQLLQILVNMGFPKDEAHNALIQNDMNLQGAIADLFKSTNSPIGPGGPSSTNNQSVVPNNMNTPFNAQYNQSIPPSSRLSSKAPARNPIGPGRPTNPMAQQRMIVQQLQLGVQMNNIHPQILNLPLTDQTLRSIQQLLNLQQTYQHHHEQLIQFQRGVKNTGTIQQIEQLTQMLSNIKNQMRAIQQPLLGPQIPKMSSSSDMNSLSLNSLNLNSGSGGSSQQLQSQSQSRLGLWTDKAPGSKHGASSSSPLLHSSNSTPNLQGGVFSDNSPWSMGSGSGWSNVSPNNQFMDNPNESQSGINQSPSSRANSGSSQSTSFDIPEFIPGQPWPGATGSKIEDDPNITPGSVARSMSLSTAANNPGRSIGPDGDWNKGTWTNQNQDPWQKGSRPPPGLNKHVNRSVSLPQGPSEKTSAFSPVGGSWEKYPVNGNSSTWLVLRNLTPQIDGATLRTLCSQHGPLLSFFVNQSTGQALVQYASKQEGMKAHKSLNSCVLGNTTIITEFADETEVQRIIDQCHRQGSLSRSSSISSSAGSTMWGATGANLWGTPANLGPSNASTWGGSNLDGHIFSSGDFHPSNDF